MDGVVFDRQARVSVPLRLPNQPDVSLEFVVDTGYAGFLTLPPDAVTALGLPFRETISANLADNNSVDVDAHRAVIVWNGTEREVDVLALGQRPLLGTGFWTGTNWSRNSPTAVL